MAPGQSPAMIGTARPWPPRPRVSLISEFQLFIDDTSVAVPHGIQRLLAYLAMAARPVSRSRAAGQLWEDVPEERALGNLRSVIWRLRRIPERIVRTFDDRLALDTGVEVDLAELMRLTVELAAHPDPSSLARLPQLVAATEVLPGWEEEWIIVERERFRELRLHALERACEALLAEGMHGPAVHTAMAAVTAEPFRDSAQRLLVQAQLAEGNAAAALRTYHAFRDLMEEELGLEPSEAMAQLVSRLPAQQVRS